MKIYTDTHSLNYCRLMYLVNLHNIHDKVSWDSQKQNTYIGRKNALLPGSKWGNPSKLNNEDSLSRFKCILDYYIHVTHSDLFFEIYQLCNTTIGCWCYPQICHGDVLIFLINNSIINCKDAISHQSS